MRVQSDVLEGCEGRGRWGGKGLIKELGFDTGFRVWNGLSGKGGVGLEPPGGGGVGTDMSGYYRGPGTSCWVPASRPRH